MATTLGPDTMSEPTPFSLRQSLRRMVRDVKNDDADARAVAQATADAMLVDDGEGDRGSPIPPPD